MIGLSFSFVIVFFHAARMYVSEGEDETEDGYHKHYPPNPSGRNQHTGCRKSFMLHCSLNATQSNLELNG
jgi:hypothetical protein